VEGQEYQVRGRAIDAAGNVGEPTAWQTAIVDSLPPQTLIAEPEPDGLVGPGQALVWGIARDGWGVAGVEVSVAGQAWQQAVLGSPALDLLAAAGRQPDVPETATLWTLTVNLPAGLGPVAIQARATDLAGNVEASAQKVRARIAASRLWFPLAPVGRDAGS
jgi:hypothetical protein